MAGRQGAEAWLAAYERAWRTRGTAGLDALFTTDATYRAAPFEPRAEGLDAIAELWEAERSPDEAFTCSWELVAVEGDTFVARVDVAYADPPPRRYADLWVVRLDDRGRARAFEEWPFWPGQPLAAPGSS